MIEEIKIDRLEELIHEMMIKIRNTSVTNLAEGNPIEIENAAAAPLVKCVTQITGSQDLHGYEKAWVGGAGKNKYNATNITETADGITITKNEFGEYTITGTATALHQFALGTNIIKAGDYILNGCPSGGSTSTYDIRFTNNAIDNGSGATLHLDSDTSDSIYITVRNGYSFPPGGLVFKPMIRLSTVTDSTFAPYSNICPITAYSTGSVKVEDEDGHSTTYATTFPSTIYRGTEDCVKGEVTAECNVIDLGSLTWIRTATSDDSKYRFYVDLSATIKKPSSNDDMANLICSNYGAVSANDTYGLIDGIGVNTNGMLLIYDSTKDTMSASDFKSAMSGVMLAYELATPTTTTETVSNAPVSAVHGYNKIESSTGDMEVTYITEDFEPLVPTT